VKASSTFTGVWRDKNDQFHTETLGAPISFDLTSYNISTTPELHYAASDSKLAEGGSGWLASVTRSYVDPKSPSPAAQGMFLLNVTVTETDPSNAQKYLQQGAQELANNRTAIVNYIEAHVQPTAAAPAKK
jgi:hypothetical protein